VRTTVQKYGGTSVADVPAMRRVADWVAHSHHEGNPTVVVVSARGGETDQLLRLAGEVNPDRPPREVDQLLATGECAAAALLAMAVRRLGVPAHSLSGPRAGILASGRHGAGVIAAVDTTEIRHRLADGDVVVVAGFQGLNAAGDVITLGRGGSDTTAVALAAELSAARCEIYTDVPGVLTADPRVVPNARVLPGVDPNVMAEMAFAGARVLHSRAVELAAMERVEVHVRSSFMPGAGTVISGRAVEEMLETRNSIVAVAHDLDVARVLVRTATSGRDPAPEVLAVLAAHTVPVDLVARSGPQEDEFRIGFTIRRSDVDEVLTPLREAVAPLDGRVRVDAHVGKVSVIGMGLLNRPECTARMLAALATAGIPTSWVSISQLRTSAIVPRDRVVEAVSLLHETFGLAGAVPSMATV
jgi:aspartate kinase